MRISDWSSDVCSSDLDQARYVVTSSAGADIAESARAAGVPVSVIGRTGGDSNTVEGAKPVPLAALPDAHDGFFPRLMARSEEPHVGKECGSTCRSRWSPCH